ncbi:MAG: hypothetical protein AAGB19_06490 [Cyanobacteria bacterium P01_F01_bin.3]
MRKRILKQFIPIGSALAGYSMVSTLLEPATYLMAREIQTDKEAAINILFAAAEFK